MPPDPVSIRISPSPSPNVPRTWWRTALRWLALFLIGLIGASQGFSCLAIRGMHAEVAAQSSDPATGVWRGSEGFGWQAKPARDGAPAPAVLLLHGFLGTPNDLRPLAERLRAAGYAVHAVRNPGHATTPEELRTTHRDAWRNAAVEGVREVAFLPPVSGG